MLAQIEKTTQQKPCPSMNLISWLFVSIQFIWIHFLSLLFRINHNIVFCLSFKNQKVDIFFHCLFWTINNEILFFLCTHNHRFVDRTIYHFLCVIFFSKCQVITISFGVSLSLIMHMFLSCYLLYLCASSESVTIYTTSHPYLITVNVKWVSFVFASNPNSYRIKCFHHVRVSVYFIFFCRTIQNRFNFSFVWCLNQLHRTTFNLTKSNQIKSMSKIHFCKSHWVFVRFIHIIHTFICLLRQSN